MPGQEAVQSVNGPMARTLQDMEVFCHAVVGEKPWLDDPRCLPIPWRQVDLPEKLKIAVLWHDGMVVPTPPVTRALKSVVEKLQTAGVDIVDWDPADQLEGATLLNRMFVADGGNAVRDELNRTGEPVRPEMVWLTQFKELSTSEMWRLHIERTAFQKKYLDRWNEAGIDAILCPTSPFCGVENGKFKHGEFLADDMDSCAEAHK